MKFKQTRWYYNKIVILISLVILIALGFGLIKLSKKIAPRLDKNLPQLPYAPHESLTLNRDLQAKMLFNNTSGQAEFSPKLVTLLLSATQSIDLAMYSIDSKVLRDALYASAKRGVQVNLVLSSNKINQHQELFANLPPNIKIVNLGDKDGKRANLMHHKFVIIDAKSSKPTLISGSLNWTQLQELYDPSFLFTTNDQDIVRVYNHEFARLFSEKTGIDKFSDPAYRPWAADFTYNNGKVELWWSPGVGQNMIKQRLLDLINQSKISISIMVWQLSDKDIVNALVAKAKNGINIKIVVDDFNAWRESSQVSYLLDQTKNLSNVEIFDDVARTLDFRQLILKKIPDYKNFNSFMHHHVIIVDNEVLMAGTNNWSYSANQKNDESALVTTIPELVSEYQKNFAYHYQFLHKSNLNVVSQGIKLFISDLKNYQQQQLVVVGESKGESYSAINCSSQIIKSESVDYQVPNNCLDKRLNVFIIGQNGQVLANFLTK